MFDPHQLTARLGATAVLSLFAALIVPNAFGRPFDDGGELVEPGSIPVAVADSSASDFDWSTALVVVLIGLSALVVALAVRHAAVRRESQLGAR